MVSKLPILANNPYMQKARDYLAALALKRDTEAHLKVQGEMTAEITRLESELAQERKERKQERDAMREIVVRLESGDLSDIDTTTLFQ